MIKGKFVINCRNLTTILEEILNCILRRVEYFFLFIRNKINCKKGLRFNIYFDEYIFKVIHIKRGPLIKIS